MKSNINFTCDLDSAWSLKYEWLGKGRVHVGIHWKGKVLPTYSGEVSLEGLRTMVDTFDALAMGEKVVPATIPETEYSQVQKDFIASDR